MASGCLKKCLCVNLKVNSLPHILAALVLMLLTPVIFGMSSLTREQAAQPLEMYLPLVGAVLFTPVFMPEQNKGILDTVRVRRMSYLSVCLMRVIYLLAAAAAIYAAVCGILGMSESFVSAELYCGGLASALFLGGLGLAAATFSGNIIAGYMAALIYFVLNYFGKDKLGVFYLFGISAGSDTSKLWLYAGAAVLFCGAFGFQKIVRKY